MKIFLSCDAEGAAGVVDPHQVVGSGPEYEMGRRLVLNEVNAAIEGALVAGAAEVVVNDSHWTMRNLPPGELAGGAGYISGRHKPLYMMEGLDDSFDAIFFVAYHGAIGAERSVLSHTYDPRAIHEVRLNGIAVGESGINALVSLHHRVPVALITGDEQTVHEARGLMPLVEGVVVKRGITRLAAQSLHPDVACRAIREGATRALQRLGELSPPDVELPARLDVVMLTADMAEAGTWIRGVTRTDARSVAIEGDDPLALYRAFVSVVALARAIAEPG